MLQRLDNSSIDISQHSFLWANKSLNHFHLNHHNTDLPVLLIA